MFETLLTVVAVFTGVGAIWWMTIQNSYRIPPGYQEAVVLHDQFFGRTKVLYRHGWYPEAAWWGLLTRVRINRQPFSVSQVIRSANGRGNGDRSSLQPVYSNRSLKRCGRCSDRAA